MGLIEMSNIVARKHIEDSDDEDYVQNDQKGEDIAKQANEQMGSRRRAPHDNMKKYYDKTYPVKNVVFDESFTRKMNDPDYDEDEWELEKARKQGDGGDDYLASEEDGDEDEEVDRKGEDGLEFDNYFENQNDYA